MKSITQKSIYSVLFFAFAQQASAIGIVDNELFEMRYELENVWKNEPQYELKNEWKNEYHMVSNACILFEHVGNGHAIYLNSNENISNFEGYMIERRSWNGHLFGWSGSDRSFNDTASSVKIKRGCVLEVIENKSFSGRRMTFDNPYQQNLEYAEYNLHHYNFADTISSAICSCPSVGEVIIPANRAYR